MQCDRFLSFSPNDKDPLISGYGPLLSVIDIYLERQVRNASLSPLIKSII